MASVGVGGISLDIIHSGNLPLRVLSVHYSHCQTQEQQIDKCKRLREEPESAELPKMSAEYEACAEVHKVVGPLYYACVEVEGISTESLVDSGSSANILSFQLLKQIGTKCTSET